MLAAILVVLVIVELAISVWCLTRFNGVLREVRMCERQAEALAGMIRNWMPDGESVPVELPEVDDSVLSSATEVLSNARPEDVSAALEMLRNVGKGK